MATELSYDDFVRLSGLVWPAAADRVALAKIQMPWFQGFDFCDTAPWQCFFVQHNNGSSHTRPRSRQVRAGC